MHISFKSIWAHCNVCNGGGSRESNLPISILQFINSNGACAQPKRGPIEQTRAGGCGRTAFAEHSSKQCDIIIT